MSPSSEPVRAASVDAAVERTKGRCVVMKAEDVEVLAVVARLNKNLGGMVLALINDQRVDGSLRVERVRELAGICDDMSALLDNHADSIDRSLTVIEVATSPEFPAEAAECTFHSRGPRGCVPPASDTSP